MRIGLLNLQYDNNYGGNLQRYALITILQNMGHDVTHLNLRFNYFNKSLPSWCLLTMRRIGSHYIKKSGCDIFPEYRRRKSYRKKCKITDVFYNKYIKHTKPIYNKRGLRRYQNFDVFIVGSDQVWRKSIAAIYGVSTFFFDYLPAKSLIPRIAYGVSLGTYENELSAADLTILTPLYKKFNAVSVREKSAFALFSQYGWRDPDPFLVLDPTLLLPKESYLSLMKNAFTEKIEGNLFCYILDETAEKKRKIELIAREKGLTPFTITIGEEQPSIEQWLRCFRDSDYIITDSYHGMVFSIIFNKPFFLFRNGYRGNARFDSLVSMLFYNTSLDNPNWDTVNTNIKFWQDKSLGFLNKSLSKIK